MQQVVLGYMVPVAEVTIQIYQNTKLTFLWLLKVALTWLYMESTNMGEIPEKWMSAYLLQPLLHHGFAFLLKICEEYFDKQCRHKRDAYMWYLPDHAGGSRIWTLSPALPCGQRNLPHFEFCYNDIFASDHFYGDRHALLTAVGNWTLLATAR